MFEFYSSKYVLPSYLLELIFLLGEIITTSYIIINIEQAILYNVVEDMLI
jgi:hypothetical protein